ncbi:MAG TPA: chemotaxis protein CheW [Firmicutes bacterium]|nr:chemotaxis protein CheW [Bacillota bacterium]
MVQYSSTAQAHQKFVVFSLEDQQYGIRISKVREIVKWAKVTRLPQTSDQICGIRNLRGEIVPIISLRSRFGLPEPAHIENSKIIILEIGDSLFGAVVDSVDEVMEIETSAIQEPPDSISGQLVSFVDGVAQSDNGLTVIIDVERLFTNGEQEQFIEAALTTDSVYSVASK